MRAGLVIAVDDPRAEDVEALLRTHLDFSRKVTPPGYSFALELDELAEPGVTFYSAREDGRLLGVCALKHLDAEHAEIKSMHTAAPDRGRGVGRAMVDHLLKVAAERGYRRVSLETGTSEHYATARALYSNTGFESCGPFGSYSPSPHNTFMTMELGAGRSAQR